LDHRLPKGNPPRNHSTESDGSEVWFRIVHVAVDGRKGAAPTTYRDQTIEIGLGSKGAVANGKATPETPHGM
jgi:hypothetical protein